MQPQPTPAQRGWLELKFGMFVHFGINTFCNQEWTDGTVAPAKFNPTQFDPNQWVEAAKRAGMRYLILVTKHHDGFCNWRTRATDYSVLASPWKRDAVGEVAEACRRGGLKFGIYYSLWDRHEPSYDDDARYAAFMKAQLTELLTQYGPIVQVWFDGTWDKMYPRDAKVDNKFHIYRGTDEALIAQWERIGKRRWHAQEIYDHIKSLQPDCLVTNNSSAGKPGVVAHWPVDLRNSEQIVVDYLGKVVQPMVDPISEHGGRKHYLPLESSATLRKYWFWRDNDREWKTPEQIVAWLRLAGERGGNFLLNVGPDARGLIPREDVEILRKVGQLSKDS